MTIGRVRSIGEIIIAALTPPKDCAVQSLLDGNITNCRLNKRGNQTSITFVTSPEFITPDKVLDPRNVTHIPLLVWIPREEWERK